MPHIGRTEAGAAGRFGDQARDHDVHQQGAQIGHHRSEQGGGGFLGIESVFQRNDLLKLLAPPTGGASFRTSKAQFCHRTDQLQIAALGLPFGFFLVALERAGLPADQSGGHQDQGCHHQGKGGQFHADAQHEQDVEAGEHNPQQTALQQLLDFTAQFVQGTEAQLQIADIALAEEVCGEPQQAVHACQL